MIRSVPYGVLVGLAAVVGVGALPASTATRVVGPPRVAGPLRLSSSHCYRNTCAYIYALDAVNTTDPKGSWRAFWVNTLSNSTAQPGYCLTEIAEGVQWGSDGRPGPAPARTYPMRGTTSVKAGLVARMTVDAGGHAKVPAKLDQRTGWTRGTVKGITGSGRLLALWEGRTTRRVPFTLGAEVRSPGSEFGGLAETHAEISVPCGHVPLPGPGFSARVEPASVRSGGTAWLQLRIPGFRPQIDFRSGLISWSGVGRATFTVSQNGENVAGAGGTSEVYGRNALPLTYPSGSYLVRATLQGTTGTRQYTLALTVR
jgi:hypothetical protein